MSIAPKWVDLIMSGQKTFELRRRAPKTGNKCLIIYATHPVSALVAVGKLEEILQGSPNLLWQRIGRLSGCTKKEFFQYFYGVDIGAAIKLGMIAPIVPIPLAFLKNTLGWYPPVSWMSASSELVELVDMR